MQCQFYMAKMLAWRLQSKGSRSRWWCSGRSPKSQNWWLIWARSRWKTWTLVRLSLLYTKMAINLFIHMGLLWILSNWWHWPPEPLSLSKSNSKRSFSTRNPPALASPQLRLWRTSPSYFRSASLSRSVRDFASLTSKWTRQMPRCRSTSNFIHHSNLSSILINLHNLRSSASETLPRRARREPKGESILYRMPKISLMSTLSLLQRRRTLRKIAGLSAP